ncbi:hemin ABC transporter substrate-binding protein [Pseudoruegeria sp. HB172150]|uniref:heme/hemin ABC transporter substrate-binding protein n=1 Tax=Pseudoruegeria sp. HB172150 TaxID=2721164 RepID=UPI0015573CEB|nr:ABC transporter substrate-binding protein [Pseudoruegeria sp. HB172150]
MNSARPERLPLPIIVFFCLVGPLIAFAASAAPEDVPPGKRLLAIGGSITEIVYALGEQDRLIARDTTSSYPAEAQDLPDVGYMRALSPEGVLSVNPDLILAEDGSGPPEAIDVLRAADVEFVTVPEGYDRAAIRKKIETVAEALGVPEKGAVLADKVDAALADAMSAAETETPKKVLFVLSTQGGRIMASGTNTAADAIIGLAGGENAITGFEGYKPLTDEAVITAAPDVILMMARGDHATGNLSLLAMPAIAATPAGVSASVVRIDGLLLLGFGPRTPEAVRRLNAALYGEG